MSDDSNHSKPKSHKEEKLLPASDNFLQQMQGNDQDNDKDNPAKPYNNIVSETHTSTDSKKQSSFDPTPTHESDKDTNSPDEMINSSQLPSVISTDHGGLSGEIKIAEDAPMASEAPTLATTSLENGHAAKRTEAESSTSDLSAVSSTTAETIPAQNSTPINNATSQISNNELKNTHVSPDTSDDGLTAEQRKYIQGASWGPLILPWYFIAQNSLKWSLLWLASKTLVVSIAFMGATFLQNDPIVAASISGVMMAYLLFLTLISVIKGRRIAWRSHYWPDFESFRSHQNKWSFWAKIYVFFVTIPSTTGIAALAWLMWPNLDAPNLTNQFNQSIFINNRFEESRDAGKVYDIESIANSLEACFTAEASGTYADCSSMSVLVEGGYIEAANQDVRIQTYAEKDEVLAYAELRSNLKECVIGKGEKKYYVYDSQTGATSTYCADGPPKQPIQ